MAGIDPRPASGWVQAALAIAVGKTLDEAAALSGCSARSIRRWLAHSETFRAKVEQIHREYILASIGRMTLAMSKVVDTLERNMEAPSPQHQIQASGRLGELLLRFRAQETFQAKLEKLQELLETVKEQHPDWFKLEVHSDGDSDNSG